MRVSAGKEDCYFWREMNDAAFALRLQLLYYYIYCYYIKINYPFISQKIIRDL